VRRVLATKVFEQRPDRVTQMVNLDNPDLAAVADAAEGPDQIPRLDRAAGAGGEYQAEVGPGPAHVGTVGVLALGLELQRLVDEIEKRKAALACASLNGRKEQLVTDAQQLLANPDGADVERAFMPSA
jgi:hypothetical protein